MSKCKDPELKAIVREHDAVVTSVSRKAIALIEKRARQIMKENPELIEYMQAMGGWHFTRKNRYHPWEHEIIYDWQEDSNPERFEPVAVIFDELDEYLHLSGHPMRFTATGKRVTNW